MKVITAVDEGHLLPDKEAVKGIKINVSTQGFVPDSADTPAKARTRSNPMRFSTDCKKMTQ